MSQPHPFIGRTLRGKWTIDALLGKGGMATVFAATHRNGMRGAIKILHDALGASAEARARFVREGRAANRVAHPGVVKVLDDDTTEDGATFLVMELLDGETWKDRWRDADRRLPAGETMDIAIEVLDVLAAAHAAGVVHRDVKPDNVFLVRGSGPWPGRVKLLDFGIARLRHAEAHAGAADAHATEDGSMMGTPAFMSPEQALARWDEVDQQSDVFAVGATLWTLLSGRLVHDARTAPELLVKAATQAAAPFATVMPTATRALARAIDRAVAFERSARWPDAAAFRDALREVRASPESEAITVARAAFADLSRPTEHASGADLGVGHTTPLVARPAPTALPGASDTITSTQPSQPARPSVDAATAPPTRSRAAIHAAAGAIGAGAIAVALVLFLGGRAGPGPTASATASASAAPSASGPPQPVATMACGQHGGSCCPGAGACQDSADHCIASACRGAVSDVHAGLYGACATRQDGALLCWGSNDLAPEASAGRAPTLVNGIRAVKDLAFGEATTFALENGRVMGWGKNVNGLLGSAVPDGSRVDLAHRVDLGIEGAVDVAVTPINERDVTACAAAKGELLCWGAGGAGRLGDRDTAIKPVKPALPNVPPVPLPFQRVGVGASDFACAVLEDDFFHVFGCWGSESPWVISRAVEVPKTMFASMTSAIDGFSTGPQGACAASGSTLTCWGRAGRCDATPKQATQEPRAFGRPIISVAVGGDHTCVVLQGGRVQCWGRPHPNLGHPPLDEACAPGDVPLPDAATKVVVGATFSCALTATGGLYCFGANDAGQLGVGDDRKASATPVRVPIPWPD